MAITVTELPSTSADIVAHSYNRVFNVQFDDFDLVTTYQGAKLAAEAVGIVENDAFPEDTVSLCDSISAVNIGTENNWYVVTVNYTKPSISSPGSGSQDPATRPTTWSYRAAPISQPATINYIDDNTGKDIENTAGDLFETSANTNTYQMVCIATDYSSTFSDASSVSDLLGTINAEAETLGDVSIAQGEGLFTAFSAQEVDDPTYGTYFVKTYEFTVDKKHLWITQLRNRGLKERYAIGNSRVALVKEVKLGGKWSGKRVGKYVDLDVNGLATRDVATGTIKNDSPVYIDVQTYKKESWNPLTPV